MPGLPEITVLRQAGKKAVISSLAAGLRWCLPEKNSGYNQESMMNALGYITTSLYDSAQRLVATENALGQRTTYGYDAGARPVSVWEHVGPDDNRLWKEWTWGQINLPGNYRRGRI